MIYLPLPMQLLVKRINTNESKEIHYNCDDYFRPKKKEEAIACKSNV